MSERSGYVNKTNTKGNLYFTVGLPASGKSTFANSWVQENIGNPRVVISGDDFRYAMTGSEYVPHAEPFIFAVMDTAVMALLSRGFDVLIDETSTSKPTLMRYLRLDSNAQPIFMETSEEECINRAKQIGREALIKTIKRLSPRLYNLKESWIYIREDLLNQIEHRFDGERIINATQHN